jgi:hypothetical protein
MKKALFAILVALTAPAGAQDEAPPPWVQMNVIHVDPQMVDEFMAVQREFSARAKKAKVPWRSVSRTHVFGNSYRFIVTTPVQNLASFDRARDADPETESLINRLRRCVTSRTSYAVRVLHDVGNPLPAGEEPDLMVMNFSKVAPGHEQDYMNVMMEDFLPHFNAAEVHHATGAMTFGGESGFVHVFYFENFAELDKGSPVMRELGAEGAQKVSAKFGGIVSSSEIWIMRRVPELSYGPEPESTEEPKPAKR